MTDQPSAILSVFAKAPRVGAVKTRLAASLGPEIAAELARAFLLDAWAAANAAHPWARAVLTLAGELDPSLALDPPPERIWPQGEGDLGQRMERALRAGLDEAEATLLVGTDLPGRPARLLDEGWHALREGDADAVLGPAEDGGFWLIGLRRGAAVERCLAIGALLDGLTWSSAETLGHTRARLEARGLRVTCTEPWFDIDEVDDLRRLARLLAAGEVEATQTARVLATLDV